MRQWYDIRAQADGTAELWIFDQIGVDFWGDGVDAARFSQDLAALDATQINLHVNSPGGNFFDGVAIHAAIQRHPARVTAYVDGYAASIAWLIVQAADHRVMAENGFQMFHKAYGICIGNDEEMATRSRLFTKLDDQQTSTAVSRGYDEAAFREALASGDTWLNASESVEAGFADEVAEPVRAAALAAFDFKALGIKTAPPVASASPNGWRQGDPVQAPTPKGIAAMISADRTESRSEGGAPGTAASDAGGAPDSHDAEVYVPGVGFSKL